MLFKSKSSKIKMLNPEDIFADPRGLHAERLEFPLRRKKIIGLYAFIGLALGILFLRAGYLQIIKGKEFTVLANNNQSHLTKIQPKRGIIYDRNMQALVQNKQSLSSNEPSKRYYFFGKTLAHVLGYTGKISQKELEKCKNCSMLDYTGKAGLEMIYEIELRGKHGIKQDQINAKGQVKKSFIKIPEIDGKNLILHLDLELQKKLYQELESQAIKLKIKKAAGVIINPKNGGVLAMASLPSYDNNLFSQGILKKDYQDLINNNNKPLFNRVISGEYPPGSTIKPVIASAALQEEIIDPMRFINDNGYIKIANPYDPGVIYTFSEIRAHHRINMPWAIANSCNVYFYTISGGYKDIKGLGIKNIKKYAEYFGLNNFLGIDLPGETNGLIPDKSWKKRVKSENWYIGDTYNSGIGQGDITATPLQVAMYTSVIANNGTLYQPQILNKIVDNNKLSTDLTEKIIRKNFIDLENLKIIQDGMEKINQVGFGLKLQDLPITVAGKTGTSQFGNENKTHAWFTSYAPAEKPEIVITILMEQGGFGSSGALPVAKNIYKWYFSNKE
ncbi:penicillin-binding protein 2 [bacterium]|nr:penicillin-binding protein 2 [bacterium]